MKVQIYLHTPLHIGDGEKLEPMTFFRENNKINVINQNKFFKILAAERGGVDTFANWIDNELKRNPKPKLNDFLNSKPQIKKEMIKSENILYSISGNTDKTVSTVLKSNGKLYIPGTEIKGAIRTAILYKFLKENNDIYKKLEDEIIKLEKKYSQVIASVSNLKKANKKKLVEAIGYTTKWLENEVFNYDKSDRKDAKFDILKYLIVGDSELREVAKDNKELLEIKELLSIGTKAPDSAEFIKNGFIFKANIKSTDINQINKSNCNISNLIGIEYIKDALYQYTGDLLKVEENYYKNEKLDNEFETKEINRENILKKIKELNFMNSPQNPLIRIGKYKGHLSQTISLIVRNKNPKLYDSVLSHFTKGTSYEKDNSSSFGNYFPKTRRVSKNSEMFGWCQLIFNGVEFNERKKSIPK